MQSSGIEILPFWQRLPQFFLYPFKPAALAIIAGLTALFVFLPPTLLGALVMLVLGLFFSKYLFEVLMHSSEGFTDPPPLNADTFFHGYEMPVKQFAVFILISIAQAAMFHLFGIVGGGLFAFFTLAALPASTMVLAGTQSLRAAINPLLLIGLMSKLGWTYVWLYGCLILLNGSAGTLVALLWGHLPETLLLTVWFAASIYFMIIMFDMMGYALYQHHDQLGYAPLADDAGGGVDLELYERFLAAEQYEAAREELRSLLHDNPEELELHEQFHRLCKLTNDRESLARHGNEYIHQLMNQQRVRQATDIYLACKKADPKFSLKVPTHYLAIASMLRERGAHREAIRMINGFHNRFPKHPDTLPLYLLAAQLFHAELNEPARAAKILQFVAHQFPEHPELPSVEYYLKMLEKTA